MLIKVKTLTGKEIEIDIEPTDKTDSQALKPRALQCSVTVFSRTDVHFAGNTWHRRGFGANGYADGRQKDSRSFVLCKIANTDTKPSDCRVLPTGHQFDLPLHLCIEPPGHVSTVVRI
ncbi:hypothetical protein Z043_114241 [Scleropages formosus]|uniref:Uncharacterized protein n=1 Tax=Scleropages formosus TaxID=113540 RepID=A0A0P7TZV6_SCLFO|nr:hypothetical protein Z043_114241 [Scleropages formosus]